MVDAFLQAERSCHGPTRLSFPRARAVMTKILTAFPFVTYRQKVEFDQKRRILGCESNKVVIEIILMAASYLGEDDSTDCSR